MPDPSNLQACIHNIAKKYMSRRNQGRFMGEIRALLDAPYEGVRVIAFTPSTDDGDLISANGYRLAYGGTPSCWRVKPEDFPTRFYTGIMKCPT